ncbi:glycosyltransferase [Ekhidna sp.]|uniref:glycosyltransferase n=1 Tax=Ekhidna sp. TaxID=2608089 RepID=UPI003299DFCC
MLPYILAGLHLIITVYLALAFAKKSRRNPAINRPPLSIAIAGRNEEYHLRQLVPQLLNQDYPDFEIIIALDRCTDGSLGYLKSLRSEKIHTLDIKEVPSDWNSKKFALQQACNRASGEFLVFTDADCVPASAQWLSSISGLIEDSKEIIIGISPYQHSNSFLSQYIRFEAFMTAFLYVTFGLKGDPYMAVGRNLSIRRSFFNKMGGYETFKSVTGGDDDLFIQKYASKSNIQMMLGEKTLVYTTPESNWKSYFRQKLRHFSVGHQYKWKHKILLSLVHASHLLFLITILPVISLRNSLWLVLFYLFIKLVSYRFAASKMGININYMLLPLVDMLYAVLTPVISLWSKLVKDITWKN